MESTFSNPLFHVGKIEIPIDQKLDKKQTEQNHKIRLFCRVGFYTFLSKSIYTIHVKPDKIQFATKKKYICTPQ